jgi:hypothetical protein
VVLGGDGEGGAVVAGRGGRRPGPGEQDEAGDSAGVVRDVVGEDRQAELVRGQRGGDRGVDLSAGDLSRGLAGGAADQHVRVGQVAGDPVAGLGDPVVVRRDRADVVERGPPAAHDREPNCEQGLLDDHQGRLVEEPVEHGRHGALDAVLDGHAPGVRAPVPHRREHGETAGAGQQLGAARLGKGEQGLLGEGRVRTEERQSGHGRRA